MKTDTIIEITGTIKKMHEVSEEIRLSGKRIGLFPTLGFLHEGHLELIRQVKERSDFVVMSLFVNPTQFGPNEDFEKYPRDTEGDLKKAKGEGVDMVFMPPVQEMYPAGFQSVVRVDKITGYLCGKSRPGHFEGVTTVVAKLFNIIKPHIAVFGQKDFQQLAVIRRMVKDLDMDIEILGVPTVREPDGLAMSSRNKYLNHEQRKSALSLKKAMELAERLAGQGEKEVQKITASMKELILSHPFTSIDYMSICDPDTLVDITLLKEKSLVALAVKVGNTRLIDNCLINTGKCC
ncbi:MAG: pantoate--beta-alanine ligase [Deltaproteobacteria bacterium]|nr:pantoate--beta-alanine ligase [Deltaproteobacteria bacterium]